MACCTQTETELIRNSSATGGVPSIMTTPEMPPAIAGSTGPAATAGPAAMDSTGTAVSSTPPPQAPATARIDTEANVQSLRCCI